MDFGLGSCAPPLPRYTYEAGEKEAGGRECTPTQKSSPLFFAAAGLASRGNAEPIDSTSNPFHETFLPLFLRVPRPFRPVYSPAVSFPRRTENNK